MSRPGTALIDDKHLLANFIFRGKHTPKNMFNEIVKPLLADEDLVRNIRLASTNMKRVEIADKVKPQDLRAQFKVLEDAFTKNEELAGILSWNGDVKFAKSDYTEALRYFNLALLAVPSSGTQIVEIYFNRATVFAKLNDTTSGLKDLEMAMKHSVSVTTKAKITNLIEILNQSSSRMDVKPQAGMNIKKKAFRDKFIFKVQGPPNPKIPVAAKCIEVKFNEEKGRHLVTKTDLAPGTTIIVEDPYVNIMENSLLYDTEHCGNSKCHKKSCSLIPCNGCMFVMYCDEKCRMEALKNGHLYECACMVQLHGLRTQSIMHASFRSICKAGPTELHNLYLAYKEKKPEKPIPKRLKGFNPKTGIYESNSYYQMRKLHSVVKKDALPVQTIRAVILAHFLNINTDFYKGEPEGPERNTFIRFVAAKILFHATSYSVNCFGLTEKLDKNPVTTTSDDKYKEFSTAVYPFISLISHSCFPNCRIEHLRNGKMVITTRMVIKSGGEISISYGYSYEEDELDVRRSYLTKFYHFTCSCVACSAEWPHLLKCERESAFICSKCSGEVNNKGVTSWKYSVLTPTHGRKLACEKCKTEVDRSKLTMELKKCQRKYFEAKELLDSNKAIEALPRIVSCIEFFQQNLAPPSRRLCLAMCLLGRTQSAINMDLE